ncbi:hypothetical protein BGZ57DRAFT_997079 [Hyaloscypha finlandica]|nr:hypothetical protein BGZ57DRAFT_997079 [Hyaloscypha finlandica]
MTARMGEAAIGWSIREARELTNLCNEFRKAYSDGGMGASRHLSDLSAQIEQFEAVLAQLEDQVILHNSKIFINYTSIENTLKECKTFFKNHPMYLKAPEQRSKWEQYQCTVEYVLSAKKEVDRLCKMVESHYHIISMYLAVLNTCQTDAVARKYNEQQLKQGDELSKKVERMDSKLNLILRAQQRHYSMAEIPTINPIGASTSLDADRSASPQLLDLEVDYSILKKLRKESADDNENKILDSMISDLRRLKNRVKYMAKREGNKAAQKRLRGLDVDSKDSGVISDGEYSSAVEDEDEEFVDDEKQEEVPNEEKLGNVLESGDSAVSFMTSDYVSRASTTTLTADQNEPLSPGRSPPDTTSPGGIHIVEIKDVQLEMAVGRCREPFNCTLKAKFFNNVLSEISAEPPVVRDIQMPVITFVDGQDRPTPSIRWRGPSSAGERYAVMLKGKSAPACQPEYKFSSEDESIRFQELVHGKRLLSKYSLNVKSIQSKAGDESGASVLRIWKDSPDENDTSVRSHSLMYFYNTANDSSRHQPEEVSLTDFEWPFPKSQKPSKWKLTFKQGVRPKQQHLKIAFREDG